MAWHDTGHVAPLSDTRPVSAVMTARLFAAPPGDAFAADVAGQAARAVWAANQRTLSVDIPALVWASVLEGSLTAEAMQRVMLAALAGKTTGAGTAAEAFRSVADDKDRISTTFDGAGNRTAATLDGTP